MRGSFLSRRSFLKRSGAGALAVNLSGRTRNQLGGMIDRITEWFRNLFEPPGTPVFVLVRTVDCNGDRTEARFESFQTEFTQGAQYSQGVEHAPVDPYEIRKGEYVITVHHRDAFEGQSQGTGYFSVTADLQCPDGSGTWQEVSYRRARLERAQDPDELYDWLTGLSNLKLTDWRFLAKFALGIATEYNLPSNFNTATTIMFVGNHKLECECPEEESTTANPGEEEDGSDSGDDGGDATAGGGSSGPSDESVDELEDLTADLEAWIDRCDEIREALAEARQRLEANLEEQRTNRERIERVQAELEGLRADSRIWIYQNTNTGELVFHAGQRFDPSPPLDFKGSMLPRDAIDEIQEREAELDRLRNRRSDLRNREQEIRREIDRLEDELEACERECADLRSDAEAVAERIQEALEGTDDSAAERALRRFGEAAESVSESSDIVIPPIAPPRRDRGGLKTGFPIHSALNWEFLGIDSGAATSGLISDYRGGYLFIHPDDVESFPFPLDVSSLLSFDRLDDTADNSSSTVAHERVNLYYTYGEGSVGLVGIGIHKNRPVEYVSSGYPNPTMDAHIDALTIYVIVYAERPEIAVRRAWEAGLIRIRGRNAVTTVKTGVPSFVRDLNVFIASAIDAIESLLSGVLG